MSPEQKQAASERMKAMHAKKKLEKEVVEEVYSGPLGELQAPEMPEYTLEALSRRIDELNAQLELQQAQSSQQPNQSVQGLQTARSASGTLIGTFEKYLTSPDYYPDPCSRLALEPRLKRFAFESNYELEWAVTSTSYETIDHVRVKEPKFSLSLIGVIFDNEGEPTNQRYLIKNAVFHEDPDAAITIAREKGLTVDENNQRSFLDEMRYMRMRDWLLEVFYAPKNNQPKRNKKEIVIGNKLVQTWEISSESTETIPFGDLKTKL